MTKRNKKNEVKYDPLTDDAADKLLQCFDNDMADAYQELTYESAQGRPNILFDMYDPDNYSVLMLGIDDLRNYIYSIRNKLNHAEDTLEKSRRGCKFWEDKYNKETKANAKTIEYWRGKYKHIAGESATAL